MPKLKPTKHAEIILNFRTWSELEDQVKKALILIRKGVEEFSETKDGNKTEYRLSYLQEFEHKIEEINGEMCMIIPSKMNKL